MTTAHTTEGKVTHGRRALVAGALRERDRICQWIESFPVAGRENEWGRYLVRLIRKDAHYTECGFTRAEMMTPHPKGED